MITMFQFEGLNSSCILVSSLLVRYIVTRTAYFLLLKILEMSTILKFPKFKALINLCTDFLPYQTPSLSAHCCACALSAPPWSVTNARGNIMSFKSGP